MSPLDQAIKTAGGQCELAEAIGVSQQAVSWWLRKRDGKVPAEFCMAIQRTTGVSASALRPDVFGNANASEAA